LFAKAYFKQFISNSFLTLIEDASAAKLIRYFSFSNSKVQIHFAKAFYQPLDLFFPFEFSIIQVLLIIC
jgi:hypothetical protein